MIPPTSLLWNKPLLIIINVIIIVVVIIIRKTTTTNKRQALSHNRKMCPNFKTRFFSKAVIFLKNNHHGCCNSGGYVCACVFYRVKMPCFFSDSITGILSETFLVDEHENSRCIRSISKRKKVDESLLTHLEYRRLSENQHHVFESELRLLLLI